MSNFTNKSDRIPEYLNANAVPVSSLEDLPDPITAAHSVTAIVAPGSGYSVGDVLTVVGGTFTTAAQVTVATLVGAGSTIESVNITNIGEYSVAPTGTLTTTSSPGSGATLTMTFGNSIILAGSTVYKIKVLELALAGNQLVYDSDTWIIGIKDDVSIISDTTAVPMFITNGASGMKCENIEIEQTGTGDSVEVNTTAQFESVQFNACTLKGGDVSLISSFVVNFDDLTVRNGSRISMKAHGANGVAVRDITLTNVNLTDLTGAVSGIINFEPGSKTISFSFVAGGVFPLFASDCIKIGEGATIERFFIDNIDFESGDSGSNDIVVNNPDSVNLGSIINSNKTSVGGFTKCSPTASPDLTSIALSVSGVPMTAPEGLCFDGEGNLLVSDTTAGKIYKFALLDTGSAPTEISIASANAIFWYRGNLFVANTSAGNITEYAGFTASIVGTPVSSLAGGGPAGITFVGSDLVEIGATDNTVYVHEGFTSPLKLNFTPFVAAFSSKGIDYDGFNIAIAGDQADIFSVQEQVTGTQQYSFSTGFVTSPDILDVCFRITDGLFYFIDNEPSTKLLRFFEGPVTFDHSSASWRMENTNNIINSSAKGGSIFSSETGIALDAFSGTNDWVDVAQTNLFYAQFSESEKSRMTDDANGEVTWLSDMNEGSVIGAQVSFARGGAGGTNQFEIAIAIDNQVVEDSIAHVVLPINNQGTALTTLPLNRTLDSGQKPRIKMRGVGNMDTVIVYFSKISIT